MFKIKHPVLQFAGFGDLNLECFDTRHVIIACYFTAEFGFVSFFLQIFGMMAPFFFFKMSSALGSGTNCLFEKKLEVIH